MERLSPARRAEIEKQALLIDSLERSEWKVAEVARDLLSHIEAVEQENTALREALVEAAARRIVDETDLEQKCPYCPAAWDDFSSAIHEEWCPREIMAQALAKLGGETDAIR